MWLGHSSSAPQVRVGRGKPEELQHRIHQSHDVLLFCSVAGIVVCRLLACYSLVCCLMSKPNGTGAPAAAPFSFCSWYSTRTLAKFSVTDSVSKSVPLLPACWTELIKTSVSLILTYSIGFSPALRTVINPS